MVPTLLAGVVLALFDPAPPELRWDAAHGRVEVVGLPADLVRTWTKSTPAAETWPAILSLRVEAKDEVEAATPPIAGDYVFDAGTGALRFTPRYPLIPGLGYRATFRTPNHQAPTHNSVIRFVIPRRESNGPRPRLATIYPTSDILPENQLKIYLQFDTPMTRGQVGGKVRLLDESGRPIELPFLELAEELWDREGRRLTLLFDPGRVKRELRPRAEEGPILESGRRYTLVVSAGWEDAEGRSTESESRKTFRTGPRDDRCPDPAAWTLRPPRAGGRDPLIVTLNEPLDRALMERVIAVQDGQAKAVAGTVEIADEERTWRFTPERPWMAGAYALTVDVVLEDLAGNRVDRPFELDEFSEVTARITASPIVRRPFRVAVSGR